MTSILSYSSMATQGGHHNHGAHTNFFIDNGCNLLPMSPLQLQTLDHLYSDDKNPTKSRLENYASGLGLTYEQVRKWYVLRRQRDKRDAANIQGVIANGKTKMKKKNLSSLDSEEHRNFTRRPVLIQDMLYSPDYIFKKIFRKDGPFLGVEFDPLPSTAFSGYYSYPWVGRIIRRRSFNGIFTINQQHCFHSSFIVTYWSQHSDQDSGCRDAACQGQQRPSKRRKVIKPAILASEQRSHMKVPTKKHGKGKGLMSALQIMNLDSSFRDDLGAFPRAETLPCENNQPTKRYGKGKGFMTASQLANPDAKKKSQRRKPTVLRRSGNKVQEKRKPLTRQRKVECSRNETQKARRDCCKIALDLVSSDKSFCSSPALADDEELELREGQAGPNPLTCGAHLATNESHGCSLCKGLLPKFPPDSVKMRKPLFMHPWNSSLELEKKLFKVFHFLYTYAVILDLCPFTLDGFVKAFHDKDSSLLGKLHICLLGLLLSDIQTEISNGVSFHSNKSGMYLNLLHMAETHKFVLNFWRTSLNPLTWTEILRQVLVAAGVGSKDCKQTKGCLTKEAGHMVKYGLHPDTLKGKLFSILFEQGNKGMKVTDLARCSQMQDLTLGKTNGELEDSICSILASDITLFEKISPYAYRLRLTSILKRDEDAVSDSEDFGSIDDESRVFSFHSIGAECESGNCSSRPDMGHQSPESNLLSSSCVIDESNPGESWLLGLMEGEYSDLSIEEKLNALLALVDLLSAGSSIRMKDPLTALAECIPRIYQHGSGGKIKRSTERRTSLLTSSCCNDRENCGLDNGHLFPELSPVDSSVVLSMMCKEGQYSGSKEGSSATGNGDDLHPMQSIYLGSDRRYNRYWFFLGPCDADDPGHRRIYFESSEDGEWQVIESEEALCCLLATLNDQGRREAVLLASLEKHVSFLLEEMSSMVLNDVCVSQSTQSGLSEIDRINEDSLSPISDIDNLSVGETSCNAVTSSGAAPSKVENKVEEQKERYERLQAYDSWIWSGFYSNLHSVRHGKRSLYDSWTRCRNCNDLHWRDEKHCKICHTTFELDFDLEEKYALHVATCQGPQDSIYTMHKVLPSKLQAIKAAIHVIELVMPEDALIGAWKKSAHKLWVRRLRRTSTLHELLQVVADFVGSLNVDWVSRSNVTLRCESTSEDFVEHFHNMPQTSSAVALWLMKFDALVALQLDEVEVVGSG